MRLVLMESTVVMVVKETKVTQDLLDQQDQQDQKVQPELLEQLALKGQEDIQD